MCAVISIWLPVFSHIIVLYVCPFSMLNLACPMDMIYATLISKAPAHSHFDMIILTDFSLISYWFFADALLLIWPRHTFVLIWLWPNFFLSRWLNSRIEMTTTSYWYEGKERGFFTLCYLSIWVSFFLSLIQKIWRSFAINERHFLRWNDRSFWAPKILSMGQQIRAQKLSIFYHFNRTDDF